MVRRFLICFRLITIEHLSVFQSIYSSSRTISFFYPEIQNCHDTDSVAQTMGVMPDFDFSFWWKSWSCLHCQRTNRTVAPALQWTQLNGIGASDSSNMLCTASTCVFPREFERVGDTSIKKKNLSDWDFPSGPRTKTPCFQSRGPGFDSWSGNYIPYSATKTWCSQRNK